VKEHRSLSSVAEADLFRYLRLATAGVPGKVYCVADALDEMDGGNAGFIQALATLGEWNPGKIKLLITSRPKPSVEGPQRSARLLQLRLAEKEVDADIANYVERGLQASEIPSNKWDQIREAVPGRANGIFLYAKTCHARFCPTWRFHRRRPADVTR
jgi:hypothetical protein